MKNFGKIVDPKDMVTKEYVDKFLPLSGGHVTGPVTFGDSITVDEATIGDLVVNGNASFTNNIQANKINGVTVGNNPKFTDTLATATTTGSGNAITAVSATNGALTFTKGSTFLTGITSAMVTTALGYIPVSKNYNNSVYTNIASNYVGSSGDKPYWKITIPNISTIWTIITLYFNIQQSYSAGLGGKLIVNGYHSATSPYTWSGLTFSTVGYLSSGIQVYACEGDTFYIGGVYSYVNIDLEKVLVADAARGVDISNVTIERVAELPEEYVTASFRQNQFVGDIGNGAQTTFAYSKAGLTSVNWLAAWNGYELRAVSPSNITAGSVAWGNVSGKPSETGDTTTGISISDHNTGSIIGVQSTTTTASKVTFGPVISIPNVTSVGSASNWVFEDITVPKAASSTACDDITSWSAGGGSASLTMTMDTTDTKKLIISFSHTHTAPTLNYTARSITGVSGSTTASHVKSGGNGSAPTLGTAISVPNVTGASDVTVPIKNASSTTVVTGNKHTITDSGHSHSI